MPLSAEEVARGHERLGSVNEIVAQRRVLYATAVELYTQNGEQSEVEADVLDNPIVRGHLGEVLGGRARYSADRLRPLSELVAGGFETVVGGWPVRLAAAPSASKDLSAALGRVSAELRRHGEGGSGPRVLTADRPAELDAAYALLIHGVRLAVRVAPALALDVLPHVGLFAIATDPSGRLGSASAREFPGVVLLPEPRSALEVAEALIHEGAHQKFFDFAMTRAIFDSTSFRAPNFVPSWAPDGAPDWPLEQALAAWHAYRCLDVFARCLDGSVEGGDVHVGSLLPKAAGRAAELGDWLRRHGSFLGEDAHELIGALDGVRPSDPPTHEDLELPAAEEHSDGSGALLRRVGTRTLVATRSTPPDLYWVRLDARSGRTDECW